MTIIVWKIASAQGTCLSRYKARREEKRRAAERDQQLLHKIERSLQAKNVRVSRAIAAAERRQTRS